MNLYDSCVQEAGSCSAVGNLLHLCVLQIGSCSVPASCKGQKLCSQPLGYFANDKSDLVTQTTAISISVLFDWSLLSIVAAQISIQVCHGRRLAVFH